MINGTHPGFTEWNFISIKIIQYTQ